MISALGRSAAFAASTPLASGETATTIRVGGDTNSGFPQAHEDDAERAVRSGLEVTAAVSGLKTRASLQTRVGIATGQVVVGDLMASGNAPERGIIGETPNLAARLQGLAEPNTVVIAEGTRKLLGNLFELADLGANELKGIAGPVRAWAVLRPRSMESRFELNSGEILSVGSWSLCAGGGSAGISMDVEICETKEFLKAVKAMKMAGGRRSKAADQVLAMRSSIVLQADHRGRKWMHFPTFRGRS